MSLINIKDLTFGYDGTDVLLFSNVNIGIDTTWRLALAGRNGRGKTTFFKLLKGELDHEGEISGVPMTVSFPSREIPDVPEWKIRKELNQMGADPDIMYRPFETLSGGERTKLMLAALFSAEDAYPLIDEPTNHLDLEGREAVASYLAGKSGFIMISHDREFLDRCTDHTLVITKTGLELVNASYSVWWDNNEARMESEQSRNDQLKKEMSSLESAMKKNAQWSAKAESSKNRAHASSKVQEDHFRRAYEAEKARKLMSLSKNLQNRNEKKLQEKQSLLKDLEKTEKLKITGSDHHSRTPVIFKDVTVMRDGMPVVCGLDMEIRKGEKTALLGPNGSGKSTVMKYIRKLGDCEDEGITAIGDISIAKGLKISYVSQDTSGLNGNVNEIGDLSYDDRTLFNTILVKMGFTPDMLRRDVQSLSLGQKKCVLIALSLCEHADLYIWDEPLNYIDIYMRKEIERLVKESDITMLFVEHDRSFEQAVADSEVSLPHV